MPRGHECGGKCWVYPKDGGARFRDCYAQYQWNKKMQALLAQDGKAYKDFRRALDKVAK